jgi:hypothetical protein
MTALAVMQDDTVLCTNCLHEHQADSGSETAGMIVHAWLADPAGETCQSCGASGGGVLPDAATVDEIRVSWGEGGERS